MKNSIFITGHKNPDTDSICSTIAYADLKTKLGYNVTPVRLGNLNSETNYILEKFQVKAPALIHDIKTRISDIEIDEALTVSKDTTIAEAWRDMIDRNKKVVAVVNSKNKLIGLTTISAITNGILSVAQNRYDLMQKTPLKAISETLLGSLVYEPDHYKTNGIINIGTSSVADKDFIEYKDKIVITSFTEVAMRKAITTKAALVIVTLTKEIPEHIVNEAIEHKVALICTTLDMFSASQMITQSIPIKYIMTTNLVTFNHFDYLDDVKAIIPKTRYRSYPVVDQDNTLIGLISRYHLWEHSKRKLILVDHNEVSQSVEGIEQAEVIEIIDHHRIGDVQTPMPISFRNEIVGSTATIIAKMYQEKTITIEPTIAALLLGAIISDTMHFKSPTCTGDDIRIAQLLAKIAEIDIDSYAQEIYLASASLAGKSISEIIHADLKTFNIDNFKLAIGQINIIDPKTIKTMQDELLSYLDQYAETNEFDFVLMIFTDIQDIGSYFLYTGSHQHLFKSGFGEDVTIKNDLEFIHNILSRKKQILPVLAREIASYNN